MELIMQIMSYPFMVRAFIVGILVSLCAALLGVSLVLKQYSMIGDGLSHVSYGALSIALACGIAPLKLSIPVVIVSAFFLLRMTENNKMKSDAAIAALSASALAIGSVLAMTKEDVVLSVILSILVLILFVFSYHNIFAVTFDENFSKATGVRVGLYNTLLSILTAVTIVLGMQMMGAMLISSLIIFPALTSMRLFKSFRAVIISSGILSVVCFSIGMILSYCVSTPAGASVVLVNLAFFLLFALIQKLRESFGMA